jgi:hypothetical protein
MKIRNIAVLLLAAASTASAQREDRWDWSGAVPAGRTIYVRNMNGAVRVEGSTSNTVEVIAYKKASRRASPSDVRITVEQRAGRGDVIICAIWFERQTRCDEDGYSTRSNGRDWWDRFRDDNDRGNVNVEFVVRLPRGVRITASSINGGIEIDGAESEIDAHTVNGSIRARTSGGPVRARTTNGSLNIRVGELGNGPMEYTTTNGQIVLEVPDRISADVELRTVNGSISTDFPLTIEGRFNTRSVRGTIGRGGQLLRLQTTNGSIQLRRG